MGVKPIIEVEVNDAEFRRFYDLFETYAAELDDMPEAWRTIGAAMGESTKGFETGALSAKEALAVAAAQAGMIAEAVRDASKATNSLDRAADKGAKSMDRLRRGAEGVGKAISTVGGWILKIGALGGLGAVFSGFGIGELAGSAFRRYRAAGQLGISPGALASFQVNAQQFLTTSALDAAANARNDVSKAGYLAVLGIRYNVARAMTTSDLAFAELKAARAAYLANPALAMQNPVIQSYLAIGGNIGDVRNAANVPLGQLLSAQSRTRADAQMLGFSRQTAQAWANLKITLDKAGIAIETDLINKLGPLAPELQKLTQGIIDAVSSFIGGKGFDNIVADAKTGIADLAQFVEKTNWRQIGDTVGLVFLEIEAVAKKLSWLIPKPQSKADQAMWAQDYKDKAARWKALENAAGGGWDWLRHAGKSFLGFMNQPHDQTPLGRLEKWVTANVPWTGGGFVQNNPLDEKSVSGQWKRFSDISKGIQSNASLLAWYPKGFNAETLAKIIPIWNGHGSNSGSYISNVEKWSGVPRNLPMKDWTKAQFAAVFAAMSREEGTHPVSIAQVIKALYSSDVEKIQHASSKAHHGPHPIVKVMAKKQQRQRPPVHVSVSNATSARVAVSVNAVATG